MKKAASVVSTVLMVAMLVAVAAFALPRVFGIKMFSVITPSMTPAYPVGTLIYVVPTDFEDLKIGDAVTVVINERGEVLTHRIVEIDSEKKTVTTHGDANEKGVNDSPALYGNVLGVVRFSIPKLGFAATFLSTVYGKAVGIGAIVVIALFSFLFSGESKKSKKAAADGAALQDKPSSDKD